MTTFRLLLFPDGLRRALREELPGLFAVLASVLGLYLLVFGLVHLCGGGQTAVMLALFGVACALFALTSVARRRWGF
jgi:hypothetical protein